ncbi:MULTISPECIES: YqzM family protein [Thermoactinomyces]|uniref:YqzM family protein n=1 Tax=Thermoactinomyces daqus TaxID=1329516 RepID=A0A7W1XCC6_9BACL|nr:MULTISPECIES: YqzM family protein [Thermoactinomyces]MBA4544071.1 YqzM family protein [Thermoactinomyces daqus]MBH8598216.1 YqzM family protein [Thermoactinomyces sp. CICC 10523]MBH8603245.1 YqzM family protein [Thermoactinomyces sp. CICC 10522]MBH8608599.1 YqzM family protein [Thermoactinomyces sp. CICC 10521]
MSAQEHTPQNQENDFIDFVKAAGVSSGIFFLIFIIAIVIDFVK